MLQKLYRFCFVKKNADKPELIDSEFSPLNNTHSLTVILHPDDAVDIVMMHPDLESMSEEDIMLEAEKFAELLVYVTNPLMESKITATIRLKSKNSDHTKEQLFYDNVITYFAVIKLEFEKKMSNNGPLIRPRSVFNVR